MDKMAERVLAVERHIKECKNVLCALHFKFTLVRSILYNPHIYWRVKVEVQKDKKKVFYVPKKELAEIQTRISNYLLRYKSYFFSRNTRSDILCFGLPVNGFERNRSIITNADFHKRNNSSWRIDLKDAFESIKTKHIYRYLKKQKNTNWSDSAWIFSRLLTYKGRLRKGSPASPYIFNLLLQKLDDSLVDALGMPEFISDSYKGVIYTRYGDDLCFSHPNSSFPPELKKVILETVSKNHFRLNRRKTREGKNGIMEFPGVVIVKGVIMPQSEYISRLLKEIESGALTAKQIDGHGAFLNQFGRKGIPKVLRRLGIVKKYKRKLKTLNYPPPAPPVVSDESDDALPF